MTAVGPMAETNTQRDLRRLYPWISAIREAAITWQEDPFLLAAICLRESGAGWAPGYEPPGVCDGWGDRGNGFGLFQIDRRYHPQFVSSPDAHSPDRQAAYACRILCDHRDWLCRVHPPLLSDPDLKCRAVLASYNAGAGALFHRRCTSADPDECTTGGDYSAWVVAKAMDLRGAQPWLFDLPERPGGDGWQDAGGRRGGDPG
jgi:hypothetical protein